MTSVRFLSFNIHGGRSRDGRRDLHRINALMDRFEIDVGIFQEFETRPFYGGTPDDIATLAGVNRPHSFAGPSMTQGQGWYGNLVISRYPLINGRVHNLETRTVFEPRNAVDVMIDTPIGLLRAVGTHLSLSPVERFAEAQKLIALMSDVDAEESNPVLLMGDINEWQWPSRLLRFLNTAMTPVSCRATFPAQCPIFRLDRIWHKAPNFTVFAQRLSGKGVNKLSDHLPLLIEVSH